MNSSLTIPTRVVSSLPPGTSLSRLLMILGSARGDMHLAHMIAEGLRDTPQVKAVVGEWSAKATVSAGTTTDGTWAGPLSAYGVSDEELALERGLSVIGRLREKFRRVPFRTTVPRETGSGTGGAWVAQGAPVPVAKTSYDTLTQEVYKASVIVVMTRELLKIGNPDAERTVRETTAAGVAAFLDSQFLTSTITAIANTRPASITNGATAVTSTGSTAAQINADLNSELNAITTSASGLTWIMRPMTAYRIAATLGNTDIPRSLFGIPIVLSINSPQQITLVDAANILYSDTGGVDIDTSDEATIQMDTAPTDPGTSATVFESLWNRNLWAVKVTRWIAYQRAQTGAVSYMTVTY